MRYFRTSKNPDAFKTLLQLIKDELIEVRENFGDERKTDINDTRHDISNEDLIPEETRVLTLSRVAIQNSTSLMNIENNEEGWARLVHQLRKKTLFKTSMF